MMILYNVSSYIRINTNSIITNSPLAHHPISTKTTTTNANSQMPYNSYVKFCKLFAHVAEAKTEIWIKEIPSMTSYSGYLHFGLDFILLYKHIHVYNLQMYVTFPFRLQFSIYSS